MLRDSSSVRLNITDIVNKKIPENSKEIGIAAEYGDLKENFEFKAAKQKNKRV